MFGNDAPPLVIPLSQVADQMHVPLVHHTPIQAWLGGNKSGWPYSWDIFFNETQQTTTQYQASNEIQTNKKVVLFTDTDPDGIAMGKLWAADAPKYGYKVVAHESFPEGTTDFSSYIQDAQAQGGPGPHRPDDPAGRCRPVEADEGRELRPEDRILREMLLPVGVGHDARSLANGTMVTDV